MRKNRLPNARAKLRGRHRASNDVVENLMECPLDLAKAGKYMRRFESRLEPLAWNIEVAIPIDEEIAVKSPFPICRTKLGVEALVQQLMHAVFIDRKLLCGYVR